MQDKLVTNRLHIAANYVTSWLVIDVIAVFPFELLVGGGDADASSLIKVRWGKGAEGQRWEGGDNVDKGGGMRRDGRRG